MKKKLNALSEIQNLYHVILALDKEKLKNFLDLPLETLQDPNSIKKALGINLYIKMKPKALPKPIEFTFGSIENSLNSQQLGS